MFIIHIDAALENISTFKWISHFENILNVDENRYIHNTIPFVQRNLAIYAIEHFNLRNFLFKYFVLRQKWLFMKLTRIN